MGTKVDRDAEAELHRAIALLIAATKRKKRSVPLTEVAAAEAVARQHLGGTAKVAERINLSSKMLGQFRRVNDLEPTTRQLVANRRIDSVDAVVQLAQLPPELQRKAAEALINGTLDTKDLRGVVELYKRDPQVPLGEIINQVRLSKTAKVYVLEFVVRGQHNKAGLRAKLARIVPSEMILDASIVGPFGRVVLTRDGYLAFRQAARERRIGLKELATLATTQTG